MDHVPEANWPTWRFTGCLRFPRVGRFGRHPRTASGARLRMGDASAVSDESWVLPAFPRSVRAEAAGVAAALPPASMPPAGLFSVDVDGELLTIPYRIYQDEVPDQYERWSATQRLVADCLYTRHHDGRVREAHARLIVENVSPRVAPFVVQLAGEYVLDIVLAITSASRPLARQVRRSSGPTAHSRWPTQPSFG